MEPNFSYLLFNKPYGVLSQFTTEGSHPTLADHFPGLATDIYPVGRLDLDSEGLLLLTNDKSVNQQLLSPGARHSKTYLAQVEGNVTDDALIMLRAGVHINVDGKPYTTLPATAQQVETPPWLWPRIPPIRVRKSIPESWIELIITEGKNRQVRKMTAAVGYPTLRLIRYAIGRVRLDGIVPGSHRSLDDVSLLFGNSSY